MPNYNVSLDSPYELVTIVEDMIEHGQEEFTARIRELEEELETANDDNSELNDRIAELEEELELQTGEKK